MTDLKQEISRIQTAVKETQNQYPGVNKWYEIVKVACERNELVKLLSADDDYAYDASGNLWLHSGGPDADLDADPISISSLISGFYSYYREEKTVERKQILIDAFNKMLRGTPQQFYFAVQIFYKLASNDINKSSPFYSIINKVKLSDELRPDVKSQIRSRKEELRNHKIFNCSTDDNGIYDHCIFYSELLEDEGAEGFVGE